MKEKGKTYIGIIIGALLIAIGLYFFWAPSNLAAGGVSGLAIVIKVLLPYIPIGIFIFALDIIMFAIGFIFLGKSFGITDVGIRNGLLLVMRLTAATMPLSVLIIGLSASVIPTISALIKTLSPIFILLPLQNCIREGYSQPIPFRFPHTHGNACI